MQWILFRMIECSRFHAASLNEVDFMRHGPKHPDWMQWVHAASLNAVYSMHCGAMDPDCMQWSPCRVMNAWIPGSLVKCIPIECSELHASQPYNETPTWNAFIDMWNLKKGQTELLCRTDTDSQTLKNLLWSPEETVWRVGGCAGVVGWKSYKIGLWWSLYNYKCNKFIE